MTTHSVDAIRDGRDHLVIDVHAHYVPPAFADRLLAEGASHGLSVEQRDGRRAVVLGQHATRPLHPLVWDRERRLERMAQAGIDVQVVSAWTELAGYHLDEWAAVALARTFNDALAEDLTTAGGRFLGLAAIPVQHPIAAARELRRACSEHGFVGAQVAASIAGPDLGDPSLGPLWEAVEDLSCVVLVHPIGDLRGCGVEGEIDSLVGRPAETTIVMTRAIIGGLFERHPGVRLCVVHGGGFLPYQLGRLQRRLGMAGELPDVADVSRRLYYDTVLSSPAAIRFLADQVGVERLLLGTDDPFEGGDPRPLDTLAAVAGLTTSERELISGGNAAQLFGLR